MLHLCPFGNLLAECIANGMKDYIGYYPALYSYIQLDTEMPNQGKRLSRWFIQQNIDSETVQAAIRI
jgi:predicted transcriptional regulator of viral defense system